MVWIEYIYKIKISPNSYKTQFRGLNCEHLEYVENFSKAHT